MAIVIQKRMLPCCMGLLAATPPPHYACSFVKNKLNQYSEKEHVLSLGLDCKNTCHTQKFHPAKQPI
eukprot:1144255-Pelagomonas_calceolata.AAC.1